MGSVISRASAIARVVTATAIGTAIISTGAVIIFRNVVGNNTTTFQIHAPDVAGTATGKIVINLTSSGAGIFSGALTAKSGTSNFRGTLSGRLLSGDGGRIFSTNNGDGTFEAVTFSGNTMKAKALSGGTLRVDGVPFMRAICRTSGGLIGSCSDAVNINGACTCS